VKNDKLTTIIKKSTEAELEKGSYKISKPTNLSIKEVLKAFPDAKITKGSGKRGTTAATRLKHHLFEAYESPIYHGETQFYRPNGTLFMDKIKPKNLNDLIKMVT
jgi:hypothetical protein